MFNQVPLNVNTGDNTQWILWVLVAVIAAGAVIATIIWKKKSDEEEDAKVDNEVENEPETKDDTEE